MNIKYSEGSPPSEYETTRMIDCSGFFRRIYHEAVDADDYIVRNMYPSAQLLWESLEPSDSPKPGDLACYSRTNDDGEPRWHVMLVTRRGVIGACDELGKVGSHPKVDYSIKWSFMGYRKFPGKGISSSDALVELAKVHSRIDELCEALRKTDSFWERCFKCPNGGKCCSFMPENDQTITEPEWRALKGFLKSNKEVRDYALDRADTGKYCLFHCGTADKCTVHDVRPHICHLVPFMVIEKPRIIQFWNPNKDCSNMNYGPQEVKSGLDAMTDSGYKFIVEVDGHHRIRAKKIDYLIRFCKRYRKKKLSEWLKEICH